MKPRLRWRRARYLIWAYTRDDRPNRRLDSWPDRLRRMNAEDWSGLRWRAGRLVDRRGRYARRPDAVVPVQEKGTKATEDPAPALSARDGGPRAPGVGA